MVKNMTIKYFFLLIALFFFYSCFTPIKSIVNNPERYDLKKVKIRGNVVSSIELDDLNIFYLKNGKHTIAVVTEGYLPLKNEFIIVKGQVYSDFQYHSKYKMQVIYERIKIKNKRYKKPDYKYIDKKSTDINKY